MKKTKSVFLSFFMVLSLVLNFSVLSVSAEATKITLSNLPAYSGESQHNKRSLREKGDFTLFEHHGFLCKNRKSMMFL